MRIAIDARLNAYRQGGISQYTRQLMTALADIAPDDQIVSFQHRDQLRPLVIAPNVVRRTALTPPHHRFEQWALPLEVLLARPDVLHCPDFIAPLRRPCPAVVTIHDLAFMHYPEILDSSARAYYGQVTSNAPRADAVIAVSEATRQDIAQFLDIPIEQIDVIYEAAAPLYTLIELREGEARVLNSTPVVADTFMLFVSTLEPRKNLPTLLQALRICLDRRPEAGYRLVIVGRRGWRDEAIFQAARDLKLADHILFAGGVGQYDLRWLYNACRMYINPSLYEGFGLPLLEAMACGAACLAAATSSLPEIGGDAAIYVPPLDAEQWADEIMALWDDEERRAELGRLGIARARQFSWLRAARETLKVYRRAADRIVPRAEPLPAHRHSQLSEPLIEELAGTPRWRLEAPEPGHPRPCLRCGAELVAGELLMGMVVQSAQAEHNGRNLAPRVWSCSRCGYVELVIDRPAPVAREQAAAPEDRLTIRPILPVYLEESDHANAPALELAIAEAPPTEAEPGDDQQRELPVEPVTAEAPHTEAEPDNDEPGDLPVEPLALETDAAAAPGAPALEAELPPAPPEILEQPIDEAAVGAPQSDQPTRFEGASDEPAEPLETMTETGAPAPLNGTTPRKPRSGRSQRRGNPPAPETPASQPPKPRQPRSKRK